MVIRHNAQQLIGERIRAQHLADAIWRGNACLDLDRPVLEAELQVDRRARRDRDDCGAQLVDADANVFNLVEVEAANRREPARGQPGHTEHRRLRREGHRNEHADGVPEHDARQTSIRTKRCPETGWVSVRAVG